MIPLVHDFDGERVLIFGGGPVGARRARLFASEADVIVASPAFTDEDFGEAQLVRAMPDPENIDTWITDVDPALVVAATDDEMVNEAIARAASERQILWSRADTGTEGGGVTIPATARSGSVVVSVSTGGTSPTVSRYLRQEIEPLVEGSGEMAELVAGLREELQQSDLSQADRRDALRTVVNSEAVWKALDTGGSKPKQVARNVLADVAGGFP